MNVKYICFKFLGKYFDTADIFKSKSTPFQNANPKSTRHIAKCIEKENSALHKTVLHSISSQFSLIRVCLWSMFVLYFILGLVWIRAGWILDWESAFRELGKVVEMQFVVMVWNMVTGRLWLWYTNCGLGNAGSFLFFLSFGIYLMSCSFLYNVMFSSFW